MNVMRRHLILAFRFGMLAGLSLLHACKAPLYIWVDGQIQSANTVNLIQVPIGDQTKAEGFNEKSYPLVAAFPQMKTKLRGVSLCECPTPIQRLSVLESKLRDDPGGIEIYVKNDGVTNSRIYGGNKVRKLELLLGQALLSQRTSILINGTVGSNSALATMLYAKHLGLRPEVHLAPQLPSERVTRNLMAFSRALALPMNNVLADPTDRAGDMGRIHYHSSFTQAFAGLFWASISAPSTNKPFVTPPGATSILSTVAYVNAAYELAEDIQAGRLAKAPAKIYVPAGSGGTYIGLLIGIKAIPALKNTQLVAVSSGSKRPTAQYVNHFREVVNYLGVLSEGRFPALTIDNAEMDSILNRAYTGGVYGAVTPEATHAKRLAGLDGLDLEYSYTAKTMAKLIDDYQALPKDTSTDIWVFWHTHSDLTPLYKRLTDPQMDKTSYDRLKRVFSHAELMKYGLFAPAN